MFDFWYDLPTWLRAVMGLAMMGIAVVIFFATGGTLITIGIFVVGLMFLLFCNAGNSGGYNF
jgi:hypothetical protein